MNFTKRQINSTTCTRILYRPTNCQDVKYNNREVKLCFVLFSDHVPFKEFLVYPDPNYMEPAEYINEIKSPPDWDIIFQGESLPEKGKPSDYSLLKDFERIRLNSSCKSKLDETQLSAVELALKNKLVLIQVKCQKYYLEVYIQYCIRGRKDGAVVMYCECLPSTNVAWVQC